MRRCLFIIAVVAVLFSLAKAAFVGMVDGLIIGGGGYERRPAVLQPGHTRDRAQVSSIHSGTGGARPMVTINWLTRYETGIAELDAQHFRLFEVVNELIEAFRRGESMGQVAEVIDYLVNYTEGHFKTEEAWMERLRFPGLEAHQKEHQDFRGRISGLKERFDGGEPLTMEVTILLADWLEYHVSDGDQAFAEFIRDRDARGTDSSAGLPMGRDRQP